MFTEVAITMGLVIGSYILYRLVRNSLLKVCEDSLLKSEAHMLGLVDLNKSFYDGDSSQDCLNALVPPAQLRFLPKSLGDTYEEDMARRRKVYFRAVSLYMNALPEIYKEMREIYGPKCGLKRIYPGLIQVFQPGLLWDYPVAELQLSFKEDDDNVEHLCVVLLTPDRYSEKANACFSGKSFWFKCFGAK